MSMITLRSLLLSILLLSLLSPTRAEKLRLYLASPLGFSESGINFKDTVLKPALAQLSIEVIDPWTLTDPTKIAAVLALPIDQQKAAWQKLDFEIGQQNQFKIDQADALLAILDGSDVDSGTAAEVGYAFGQKKKIFGYRNDFRLSSDNEGTLVNLQVEYFVLASGGHIFSRVSQLQGLKIGQKQLESPVPPPTEAPAPTTVAKTVTTAENAKSATRNILDAFTIFPFAIVLALSLGEAFKMVVSEKPNEKYIDWEKLYALGAFLVLILPFYQGMNRYLLITYGELAKGPRPHSFFLIVDGAAFMLESALFFAMSRTLGLNDWKRFYCVALALLGVDSLWGLSVRMHSSTEATVTINHWTTLNVITFILLALLLYKSPKKPVETHWAATAALVGMVIRTIIDYWISWNFYFPS